MGNESELVDLLIKDGFLLDWSVHQHYCTNYKMTEATTRNLDLAREQYVDNTWVDVEADESVFASAITDDKEMKECEKWAVVVQRGKLETLVLLRTESDRATKKAPGPGAIKKTECKPFFLGRLKDRKVILHLDGARSYRMKAPGVFHDSVRHCKKRVKRGGTWLWVKPVCSEIVKHKLPSGAVLKWEYWRRGPDPWSATGEMLCDLMGSTFCNRMALPAPFKPDKGPGEIAFTTQPRILPKGANGEQRALKRARFDAKVRADIAEEVFVEGRALAVHWGSSADIKTPLELFFCVMDRRRAGYRFIEEFGPRADNRNQFVEWTDEKINDERSPTFGWQAADVKESLRKCASGSVGAMALEPLAATLERFHPLVFDNVVAPILKSHDVHGAMRIGKTRVGKSTASKTVGLAISACQIDECGRADLRPSVAATKKIDFLRLEPGTVFKPAIVDDTAPPKWASDAIKAFLDPAEEDALLWARWGGASFEQRRPRQICVNSRDEKFEKKAYVARSNVALLTKGWMCLWLASTTKDPVSRFPWPAPEKPDLFAPETTPILQRSRKDQTFTPPDYDMHMKWAVAAMKRLARGDDAGRSNAIRGPALFNQGTPPRCNFPEVGGESDVFGFGGGMGGDDGPSDVPAAAAPPAPAAPIKRGPGVFRFHFKKPQGLIDLSTPTPKQKRMTLDEELSRMVGEGEAAGAAAASSSDVAPA
ncbi:unnamed protein product [Prorocentrum cordatum]|uniref:Uncharacterized protein n=1 Tax=Prorocentrum cordatum TaxID=2364126 RepID=A0ABN9V729_9DINO|nr:unnamed protein product [Polarella glacialis]